MQIDEHAGGRQQDDEGEQAGGGAAAVGEEQEDGQAVPTAWATTGVLMPRVLAMTRQVAAQRHRIAELAGRQDQAVEAAEGGDRDGECGEGCGATAPLRATRASANGRRRDGDDVGGKQQLDALPATK